MDSHYYFLVVVYFFYIANLKVGVGSNFFAIALFFSVGCDDPEAPLLLGFFVINGSNGNGPERNIRMFSFCKCMFAGIYTHRKE